jgi:hypothetical protein
MCEHHENRRSVKFVFVLVLFLVTLGPDVGTQNEIHIERKLEASDRCKIKRLCLGQRWALVCKSFT